MGVLPVPEATTVVLKGTSMFRVCPVLLPVAVCGREREVLTVLAKVVGLTSVLVVVVMALLTVVVDIFEDGITAGVDVVFVILELPDLTDELLDAFDVAAVVVEMALDLVAVGVVEVPTVLLFRLVVGAVDPDLLVGFEADIGPVALGPTFAFSVEISLLEIIDKLAEGTVDNFPFSRVAAGEELRGLFLSEEAMDMVDGVVALVFSNIGPLPLSTHARTRDLLLFEVATFSSFFLAFFS